MIGWLDWVAEHTTFAFEGYVGQLSVIKENRSRGAGYWYANSRQVEHTRKRYLGRNLRLTFQALEDVACSLTHLFDTYVTHPWPGQQL